MLRWAWGDPGRGIGKRVGVSGRMGEDGMGRGKMGYVQGGETLGSVCLACDCIQWRW